MKSRFAVSLLSGVLGLGVGLPALAQGSASAPDPLESAELPNLERELPPLETILPEVGTDLPNLEDVLAPPDRRYPSASEILRTMRELPPLDPPVETDARPMPPPNRGED